MIKDNPIMSKFNASILQNLFITTWKLDNSIAYRQSDDAIIQAKVFIAARVFDYSMTCREFNSVTIQAGVFILV